MKGLYFCLRQRHSLEDDACQHSEEIISQNSCSPLCYDFISWNTAPYIKLHKTKSQRKNPRLRVSSLQVMPRKLKQPLLRELLPTTGLLLLGANLFCFCRIFAGDHSCTQQTMPTLCEWMITLHFFSVDSPAEELLNRKTQIHSGSPVWGYHLCFCLWWTSISIWGSANMKRNILLAKEELMGVSVECWRFRALLK